MSTDQGRLIVSRHVLFDENVFSFVEKMKHGSHSLDSTSFQSFSLLFVALVQTLQFRIAMSNLVTTSSSTSVAVSSSPSSPPEWIDNTDHESSAVSTNNAPHESPIVSSAPPGVVSKAPIVVAPVDALVVA